LHRGTAASVAFPHAVLQAEPQPIEKVKAIMPDLPDGNQFANVSIPGLLGAAVLFLIFLPPHPVNTIPVVDWQRDIPKPSPLAGETRRTLLTPGMLPKLMSSPDLVFVTPKCRVSEYLLSDEPHFPPFHKGESQTLQLFLEEQKESLQECVAMEQSEAGKEKTENDADARELAALEKARDNSRTIGTQIDSPNSPGVWMTSARTAKIETQIERIREDIATRERLIRLRDYEIAAMTRFSAWVESRLEDPGRLRPEQSLGDYLKALSDHVAAFLAVAACVGIIFKVLLSPISSSAFYKLLFREEM